MDLYSIIAMAHGIDLVRGFIAAKFPIESRWRQMLGLVFDIEAKGGTGTPKEKLKTLLVERFALRAHTEIRQVPVYALTVANSARGLGPGLKPSPHNCREFIAMGGKREDPEAPKEACWPAIEQRYGTSLDRSAGTINDLILGVAQAYLRDPVIDATGLTGNFEWQVAIAPNNRQVDAPNIFTAFEDQLGLKLERRVGPYEVIVIDDVRMPTLN